MSFMITYTLIYLYHESRIKDKYLYNTQNNNMKLIPQRALYTSLNAY